MATKRDYYEVLGVSRTTSADEIKRKYRKLAMQNHPDKAPADKKQEYEERFKEMSEAYAVLSDSEKRAQYDRFGHAGIDGRYSHSDIFQGVDFSSVFHDIGFGGSIFEDFFDVGFSFVSFGGSLASAILIFLSLSLLLASLLFGYLGMISPFIISFPQPPP